MSSLMSFFGLFHQPLLAYFNILFNIILSSSFLHTASFVFVFTCFYTNVCLSRTAHAHEHAYHIRVWMHLLYLSEFFLSTPRNFPKIKWDSILVNLYSSVLQIFTNLFFYVSFFSISFFLYHFFLFLFFLSCIDLHSILFLIQIIFTFFLPFYVSFPFLFSLSKSNFLT